MICRFDAWHRPEASGAPPRAKDFVHGTMSQERSAKLVVRGQGIRQPRHEGYAPHAGGLGVGPMALSAVQAGRAGGDAPFEDRHFVSLDCSERLSQESLGLRHAPFLQGDLRKQPGGGRTKWRISRRGDQGVQRLRLVLGAVELATRQPELAEPAAQEDLPGPRHRLDARGHAPTAAS